MRVIQRTSMTLTKHNPQQPTLPLQGALPARFRSLLSALFAICFIMLRAESSEASIAYGSINNFDTVNDTGHECHGFEIEIEDCRSTDITYTYNYNHYGVPRIEQDDSVPAHPKCRIRWESKKNPDGTWAAYTAIPPGPIAPTNGHMFTNPNVNFGGEHFGVGYRVPATVVHYNWLIDNGTGALVRGGAVQVSTPSFTYYPPVIGNPAPAQVQAVIAPPPPPAPEPKEFGKPVWVKEIRTTTHNNREVRLRDLVSDDPDDPNDRNWRNGEPDEVETEWQILQKDYNKADGGANNVAVAAAEDLPGGDEVVTRRYEFFKYVGPLDNETGEAMAQSVAPDGIHGVGVKLINGVNVDLSNVTVVGDFTGSQMAAVGVAAPVALIDHVGEGRVNTPYAARTIVVEGALPFLAARDGALPPGLTFNEVTGVLSGTPTASGEFTFNITASDGVTPDVSKNYTLVIAAAGAALPANSLLDTIESPLGSGVTSGDGSFAPGANVTVNATANAGYHFVNWTDNGKVVSNNASYTFVIDVNHSLVANFAVNVPQRTIDTSASPLAGGTTSGGGAVDSGSSVTVLATPNLGYAFMKWLEGGAQVSASASYTFTATADRTLVAVFAPVPTYTVATSAAPMAGGTMTGGGAYSGGTSATFSATANAGYIFSRWTVGGTLVSTSPSYTFTVTGNRVLVANFVVAGTQQNIATSASPVAGGTTSGGGIYASGDSATVVASANPGYAFSKWQEGSTTVSTSPSYTFTVAGSRTLVAKFNEAFVITANATPAVGGTTEMDSLTYKTGENARAKAFPEPGYHFANWTENGAVVSTAATFNFNVTGNRTIVANFLADTGVTITINSANAEGGTTSGDGAYGLDDIVNVSAVPHEGYGFLHWTEGGAIVSTDPDYTLVANASHALVAHFAPAVAISTNAATSVGGTVSGDGSFAIGAIVTFVATPDEGYTFTSWTDGGTVVSTDPNYTFTVAGARALVANFAPFPTMAMIPGGPGSQSIVLSWSNADPNWVLQESGDLLEWVDSTRPLTVVAGRRACTASTAVPNCFFRLVHP